MVHDLFSARSGVDLTPNRLSSVLARLRAENTPFIDLTLSNPTRAGFEYPEDILAPLAKARGLLYEPRALAPSRRARLSRRSSRGKASAFPPIGWC